MAETADDKRYYRPTGFLPAEEFRQQMERRCRRSATVTSHSKAQTITWSFEAQQKSFPGNQVERSSRTCAVAECRHLQQLQKVTVESIDLAGSTLEFQSSVNDLGILIDSQLSMREHVQRVCRSSFYQLQQLCVIRSSRTSLHF